MRQSNKGICSAHQELIPNQSLKSMVLAFKEETLKEILSLVPSLARDDALPLLQRLAKIGHMCGVPLHSGDLASWCAPLAEASSAISSTAQSSFSEPKHCAPYHNPNPVKMLPTHNVTETTIVVIGTSFVNNCCSWRCRGEGFIRPRLPDASASKQLAALLLLKLQVVDTDRSEMAKEAVALLVELQDDDQLREVLLAIEESDILTLLPSFDKKAIAAMHRALLMCDASCRAHVCKEYARRLASRLHDLDWMPSDEEYFSDDSSDDDDAVGTCKSLWQLLEANLNDKNLPWVKAAACLLCAPRLRIEVELSDLCPEVLKEAGKFLDDQGAAAVFAREFFEEDLGISTWARKNWPRKSSAPILHELALQMDGTQSEKLQLLFKAYRIDKDNGSVRASLRKHLNELYVVGDKTDAAEMEGIFLELALEEGVDIPSEVLSSLTLELHHLSEPSPKQLLLLANMLGSNDRSADGARVAVFAAKAFAANNAARESEAAFVKAVCLDPSNRQAVKGLVNGIASAHKRCDELEQCQGPRLEIGSSMVWDLSSYDFTAFTKGKQHRGEKFQIGSTGVTACLSLFPRGHSKSSKGKAGLFLYVDQPAKVKWTWQSGSGRVKTEERDFVKDWDGTPYGWGDRSFMPISEANGSVTLRILSVQMKGSTLRFS